MAINKKSAFGPMDLELADFAKAISHPARVKILRLLVEKQSCICGDLVEEMPLSQSTVSQHLKELKNAGLIIGEVEGVRVCYCLNSEVFDKFSQLFSHLSSSIKEFGIKNNCC